MCHRLAPRSAESRAPSPSSPWTSCGSPGAISSRKFGAPGATPQQKRKMSAIQKKMHRIAANVCPKTANELSIKAHASTRTNEKSKAASISTMYTKRKRLPSLVPSSTWFPDLYSLYSLYWSPARQLAHRVIAHRSLAHAPIKRCPAAGGAVHLAKSLLPRSARGYVSG